jgi:hypothetical protein
MQTFRPLWVSLEEILKRLQRGDYSVAKEVYDDVSDLPLKCERWQRKAAIELEVSHCSYIYTLAATLCKNTDNQKRQSEIRYTHLSHFSQFINETGVHVGDHLSTHSQDFKP